MIPDDDGAPLRLLLEQSREEDVNLLSIAVHNVTSGVTVADARKPGMPLIYVNPGFEEMTGYLAHEVIGKNCRFLQGEEKDQPGLDELRAALKEERACVVRLRNFKKDGTLFHNELHISPVRNRKGELTHFVGIQLDVTERVRARESLERSEQQTRQALQREAELNAIKSRFISMVSHEFRTPMTAMYSSARLLRRFGKKLSPEKRERQLENIENALNRMNRMLDDVLFFSRSEADRVQVASEPLEVRPYFEQLLEGMGEIYPDRRVEFSTGIPNGTIWNLDIHLLDHIFHNLIGNAFKYSPPETIVSLSVTQAGDFMECVVTDTGIGVPEEDRERLFEAFHRAGNVGNRQGTGLGLNIALRATELLGGTLQFQSEQDVGSSFVVRIPVTSSKDS